MSVITWLANKLGTRTPAPPMVRAYSAARIDRLSSAFGTINNQSADSTLRFSLETLRARSRDLAENNDYVCGYLELLGNKIIGRGGIKLQVRAKGGDGKPDREANNAIEAAFSQWARRGICEVSGKLSWVELQRLALESMARDGEVFIRVIKGNFNKFRLTLQLIEADMIPVRLNQQLADGNQIRMGVEIDQYERPLAYHVYERHPGDLHLGSTSSQTVRIPASDIIHIFRPHRPGQTRGVPWTAAVMTRLHHMGAYEEAAIINARIGASKMGFFTSLPNEQGQYSGDGTDASGNIITEVDPGQFERLPHGVDFKPFDPAYPSNEFDPFIKRQLKGASCGLPGATYSDMSNDLEAVNFSSIRQGTLNARDSYRSIQQLLIDTLCVPVFAVWLGQALDFGLITIYSTKRGPNIRLSPANYDKYNAPQFIGRGWDWVDPLKDQLANSEALANKLTTRSRIAAECGEDFEDILAEQQQENDLAATYGINLEPVVKNPAAPQEVNNAAIT